MPYGVDAKEIINSAELAQFIELGFGTGRKNKPPVTRADQQRQDRFDDRHSLPTNGDRQIYVSIGKSWTSPSALKIGENLGSLAIDRLHEAVDVSIL